MIKYVFILKKLPKNICPHFTEQPLKHMILNYFYNHFVINKKKNT